MVLIVVIISGCSKNYVCPNGEVKKSWKECFPDEKAPPLKSVGEKTAEVNSDVDVKVEDKPKIEDKVEVKEEVKKEEPVVKEEVKQVVENNVVSKKNNDKDVQEVLDSVSKLKSVYFDYRIERSVTSNIYPVYVKGDITKISLPVKTRVLNSLDIDTIIIKGKKAYSYCESKKWCKETGEKGEVDYNKYKIITPFEWNKMIEGGKSVGSELYSGRNVLIVNDDSGKEFLIEKYYGVPMKVENKTNLYIYNNMVFNSVMDSDLVFNIKE